MTTTTQLQALLPHCSVSRCWGYTSSGVRRFGYWATTASGSAVLLGKSAEEAIARAKDLGSIYGSRPVL